MTDPVDDFGVGVGVATGGVVPDAKTNLLGGDTRVDDFGGGAGNLGAPLMNDAGAIDFEDGAPGFAAREDDPLEGADPVRDLDSVVNRSIGGSDSSTTSADDAASGLDDSTSEPVDDGGTTDDGDEPVDP